MKKNVLFGVILFLMLLTNACKNNDSAQKTPQNPTASVNPFDTTQVETGGLSAEDRALLAASSGKSAKPTEGGVLAARIAAADKRLHVFCFFKLSDAKSAATAKSLQTIAAELDTNKMKAIFVAIADGKSMQDINLFLRENNFSDEALYLENAQLDFLSKIKGGFTNTAVPILIFANKTDDTMLMYNEAMDETQLATIIRPLL